MFKISGVLTFSIDMKYTVMYSRHLIVLYFLSHGLHFPTTHWVLNPVLCFHMLYIIQLWCQGVKGCRPYLEMSSEQYFA